MNKEDIYKLIGYQGEYSNNVKKAIRKLLKDNHPDNKGDKERFELINEVKQELENNQVSFKYPKKSNNTKTIYDIDYDYCNTQITNINKQKNGLSKELNDKKRKLSIIEEEYQKIYRQSVDLELNLLSSSKEMKQIKNIKTISIVMLVIISLIFIMAVIKYNIILLISFVFLSIICILIIQRYFELVHKMAINNKRKIREYFKINNSIRDNRQKKEKIEHNILDLKKQIIKLENDLRFYENLLK